MLKNILNLDGVVVLSKTQQKNTFGGLTDGGGSLAESGGGCSARQWRSYSPPLSGEYYVVAHNLTAAQGVAYAAGGNGGGHVCCTTAGCAASPWA